MTNEEKKKRKRGRHEADRGRHEADDETDSVGLGLGYFKRAKADTVELVYQKTNVQSTIKNLHENSGKQVYVDEVYLAAIAHH
ncbi:hypothetical protein T07_4573 [Trichinella nelsoni]|uniref:Uncharacterized protein n=1 Tax=Trichinella nelsoni TaxID=6336 RepID=A0A0V0RF03_9BILA|nr:hypothetical protein T07_4573 [Trichinella nelsoni]